MAKRNQPTRHFSKAPAPPKAQPAPTDPCPLAEAVALCPDPNCPIETFTATLAGRYRAKGELEIMFCRQIASAGITWRSIQNSIDRLNHTNDPEGRIIDRLTKAQSRALRMGILALKELKGLQERRNVMERFPDQTRDCAPLADHTPFIGDPPKIRAPHPILRGRLRSPLDHTPFADTEAAKRTAPDILAELESLLAATL